MPQRYACHYYDLYRMAKSKMKDATINKKEPLRKVLEFKIKFYPRNWANYQDALESKIRLLPS